MHIVPPPILRTLRMRVEGVVREIPLLFFAVVIGVALTFRVAIGWAQSPAAAAPSPTPEPTSVPTSSNSSGSPKLEADPAAGPAATSAATSVGARPRTSPKKRRPAR